MANYGPGGLFYDSLQICLTEARRRGTPDLETPRHVKNPSPIGRDLVGVMEQLRLFDGTADKVQDPLPKRGSAVTSVRCLRRRPPREWTGPETDRNLRTVAVWCIIKSGGCVECRRMLEDELRNRPVGG